MQSTLLGITGWLVSLVLLHSVKYPVKGMVKSLRQCPRRTVLLLSPLSRGCCAFLGSAPLACTVLPAWILESSQLCWDDLSLSWKLKVQRLRTQPGPFCLPGQKPCPVHVLLPEAFALHSHRHPLRERHVASFSFTWGLLETRKVL